MKILNRKIGYNHPPLIIAELGINHNGSLQDAFNLVDKAKKCGVEIIKHQTHVIEDEMSFEAKKIFPGNSPTKSIYDIMKECALSEKDEISLKKYIESKNMIFISTPFSREAANRLNRMNVPAFKIGSGECNNYPLVEHIANFGKPIIMSTGMNDIDSIRPSVEIFEKLKVPYALLHTTNLYPTPYHLVRLGAIQEIQKAFPNAIVGLSDHTDNNYASYGAIALGASIIERHFTDSLSREGPDISASMDTSQCKELIRASKILYKERGGGKNVIPEEKVTSDFAFATVVSIEKIKKGEVLSMKNLWVKRPGTGGIKASDFKNLLGKKANKDIDEDVHLSFSDIDQCM
jgi:sialic acid synthase SpsE